MNFSQIVPRRSRSIGSREAGQHRRGRDEEELHAAREQRQVICPSVGHGSAASPLYDVMKIRSEIDGHGGNSHGEEQHEQQAREVHRPAGGTLQRLPNGLPHVRVAQQADEDWNA